jgi:hypothetical protein
MKIDPLKIFTKFIGGIIKVIILYLFLLGIIKLFYLIDDIFYLVENVDDRIWNVINQEIGVTFAIIILVSLLILYLSLPPYQPGIKAKIIDLFNLISATLKSLSKILSGYWYLYDIEYMIELLEGKIKRKSSDKHPPNEPNSKKSEKPIENNYT